MESIEILVFDEADKLLEMGFQKELDYILANISKDRQTLLFSATLPEKVQEFTKLALKKPHRIRANPDRATNSKLIQKVALLPSLSKLEHREATLLTLIKKYATKNAIEEEI